MSLGVSLEMLRPLVWAAVMVSVEYAGVFAAVLIDLRAGTLKARRRGEKCTSRGYRRTVDKASRYFITLLALTVMDVPVMMTMLYVRLELGVSAPVFPLFTTLGAVGMTLIEVKSVMESAQSKGDYGAALRDIADVLSHPSASGIIDRLLKK